MLNDYAETKPHPRPLSKGEGDFRGVKAKAEASRLRMSRRIFSVF